MGYNGGLPQPANPKRTRMDLLFDYVGFLAKTATVVVAALIILSAVASAAAHRAARPSPTGHIEVLQLNERLQDMHRAVEEAALPAAVVKKRRKADAKARKKHLKDEARREKTRTKRQGSEGDASATADTAPPATPEQPAAEATATQAQAAPPDSSSDVSGDVQGAQTAEEGEHGVGSADAQQTAVVDHTGSEEQRTRRVFVLNFDGDIAASAVASLRQEVSAVLGAAAAGDEVLVRVESAGGAVHGYGLAASQLARVRSHGATLTVAVDKVAASGGYLMAAVADRILAAPFAVVGSIGVVAQIPNVHRLLKKHDVDVEVHTAGRFKRTLDFLGENTEQGRAKLREELEDVHALFQEYVANWRPGLDLEAVSTGEHWYGQRALDRALVDELVTSDEYLAHACQDADVFEVSWVVPKRPLERLAVQFATALGTALGKGALGALDGLMNKTTTGGGLR